MNNVNGHLEYLARHFDEQAAAAIDNDRAAYWTRMANEIRQMVHNNERLVRDLRTIVNGNSELDQHERGTLCEAIRALGGQP